MLRMLSPLQNAIVNTAWAIGFILLTLVLARTVGMKLDDRPILYSLFLLGPVVSAAFSRRLSGVVLGVLGLYAGVFLAAACGAVLQGSQAVDWRQTLLQGALVSSADLVLSVPVWGCVRRLRRAGVVATTVS